MKRLFVIFFPLLIFNAVEAQICGTPGLDGSGNISASINTYYPVSDNFELRSGDRTVTLKAVPATDPYGNNFGTIPIKAGDMVLIIQMQDAAINYENNANYGSGSSTAGADGKGGTGYSDLGRSGVFEYAIATNDVGLSGGSLTFRAAGLNQGTVSDYLNAPATNTSGKKTFQVIRVPQYSNLILNTNISTPPFNGVAGGIIAFDVSGSMNFGGKTIDASARGFRGGYGLKAYSGNNINSVYVVPSSSTLSSGKGEGVAGTPKYMWDGYNEIANNVEGLPGGSFGKGAPANGGGAGNDHNAGGGGGGNGGYGGVGGNGVSLLGTGAGAYPNGGRPGSITYSGTPAISHLIMGGGGGGGDANDALSGVKGGVGGGLVVINVGRITGTGTILANGGDGAPGAAGVNPDGAGGGGAGGTVFIKVSNPDPAAILNIEVKGGNGGNTQNDTRLNDEHGTGGGGGGGLVFYALSSGTLNINKSKGISGLSDSGRGNKHAAEDGNDGREIPFNVSDLPAYLQGGGAACYPQLSTSMKVSNPGADVFQGDDVAYEVKTSNAPGGGNAGQVYLHMVFPPGFSYKNFEVDLTGDASGASPEISTNLTSDEYRVSVGPFNISPGDDVILKLIMTVGCDAQSGIQNASAEATYLDPTRTAANPNRTITAQFNESFGYPTQYESTPTPVPGVNYNGELFNATQEDVNVVELPVLAANAIMVTGTNPPLCDSGDPALITGSHPTGGNNGYTYQWRQSNDGVNFTDIVGATDKDFDPPVIIFTTFYQRMVYSSCAIPSTSDQVRVLVAPLPTADFTMPEFCLDDASAKFINISTIADGSEDQFAYLWDFGDTYANAGNPNTSTSKDGIHRYTNTGSYLVNLTITSNQGCNATVQKNFFVNGNNPKAAFSVTDLCSDGAVSFKDEAEQPIGQITKIEWSFDVDANDPAYNYTDEEPERRENPARIYKFKYPDFNFPASKSINVRMRVFSGSSCTDELTKTILLNASPVVMFNAIDPVCEAAPPFMLNQASEQNLLPGIGVYSGDGVYDEGYFDPARAGAGVHVVTYTFTTSSGCSTTETQTVEVYPSPKAQAGETLEILIGGQIKLPAVVNGQNLTYSWSPAEGLDDPNILNPVASPLEDTPYTLTATSDNNCSVQVVMNVIVIKKPKIPNTFTPNGDGINDVWTIENLDSYTGSKVDIYNRFGQKVYTAGGYGFLWDGRLNGVDLPIGTYYYVIDPKRGLKLITGSVTIIR